MFFFCNMNTLDSLFHLFIYIFFLGELNIFKQTNFRPLNLHQSNLINLIMRVFCKISSAYDLNHDHSILFQIPGEFLGFKNKKILIFYFEKNYNIFS